MYIIKEITLAEYNSAGIEKKLMSIIEKNYYYCLTINSGNFYFDSNREISAAIIQYLSEKNKLIFIDEGRLYIFLIDSACIELAMRLWDYESELMIEKGKGILITERRVYIFDLISSIIISVVSAPDIIIDYKLIDEKLILQCYDSKSIEIDI